MSGQARLLVVDDEPSLQDIVATSMRFLGYQVAVAATGREAVRIATDSHPDLIILDVMLPGEDGVSLCRAVRARSEVPVIMLTARGDETDRIVGLEIGADDYVPKPFSPRELLARVKSVLRRAKALPPNLRQQEGRWFRFAGWQLDAVTRNLTAPDGVVVPLSATEFKLLRTLLDHPGRVLTRDQLIELMLSRDAGPFDRALDVQISRLRQRLREDAREPAIIKTVRGQGYVLAAAVESEP